MLRFLTMRVFESSGKGRANNGDQTRPASFYSMWDAVARFAQEIRASDFMAEMIRRRDAYGSEGVMGALDCATLYGLTRWLQPAVVVESGGFIGMSSHDKKTGRRDEQRTSHYEWGRWGYIGFAIKKANH